MSDHNGDDISREDNASLDEKEAAQLTAYALGQLQGEELAEFERKRAANTDGMTERNIHEIQALGATLSAARTGDFAAASSVELRKAIERHLDCAEPTVQKS